MQIHLIHKTNKECEMKKITLIITLILISATAATIVAQQGRGPMDRHRMGFNIDRLAKVLELTDEQANQIRQLHYESEKAAIDLKSSLKKNRLEIDNMIAGNNIVDSEILNLVSKSSEIQSELKTNKIRLWLDVYKILNPEQQKMWVKHFQGMGERVGPRSDRMRQKMREHAPEFQGMN
jgi:Spy/CpxP family protein refolding chaperone